MAARLAPCSSLRDIDYEFDRYEHVPITPLDILVFRITAAMRQEWPRRHDGQPGVNDKVSQLNRDIQVLRKLLLTSWEFDGPTRYSVIQHPFDVLALIQRYYLEMDDAGFRLWRQGLWPDIASVMFFPQPSDVKMVPGNAANLLCQEILADRKCWGFSDWHHLAPIRRAVEAADCKWRLCDGGAALPVLNQALENGYDHQKVGERYLADLGKPVFPLYTLLRTRLRLRAAPLNFFVRPAYVARRMLDGASCLSLILGADVAGLPGRGRSIHRPSVPRRARSEPDLSRFSVARLPRHHAVRTRNAMNLMEVCFPRLPPVQVFKRTRSRSLSRERILEMFIESRKKGPTRIDRRRPRLDQDPDELSIGRHPPCENCAGRTHKSSRCTYRCGHCGAPNPEFRKWFPPTAIPYHVVDSGWHGNPHTATKCPASRNNRCKCVLFPQLHTANRCTVLCSRPCGNPAPRGSGKHRNAMTCRFRCCMCGIRGHSGRECRLRACRCGEKHLGQDCRWNPACRAEGCDRFLCGKHCRGCGSAEKPFDDKWRCGRCQHEGDAVDAVLATAPPTREANNSL